MSINQLINELKQNNQDFEFYPTTKEMIRVIYNAAEPFGNWLDIGCGTCNFRKFFEEISDEKQAIYNAKEIAYRNSYENGKGYNYDLEPKEHEKGKKIYNYYVIEKSKILLDKLGKDVICLGTDFNSTMLLDKPVANIFCNPPYSEYEEWASRIIEEANTKNIFLIIPERWKGSEKIKLAIEKSNSYFKILGSFDFLNAERQARAKVDIIKVWRKETSRYSELKDYNETAFDQWFNSTFKIRDKKDLNKWDTEKEKEQAIKNQLVNADGSKAKILVDLYNNEIETLYKHFKAISSLDVDILETIGISKNAVKKALKLKAKGTKARYWKLAFDELEEITDRLTSKTRNDMFERFKSLQTVDFTLENIYPFILWVLKNANGYYNDQLIDFFKKLSDPDNVKPYKSNQKIFERSEWRHNRFKEPEKISHYTLDYRIIMSSPFRLNWNGTRLDDYQNGAIQTLQDIFTIANNLGFNVGELETPSIYGEKTYIYYKNSKKVFMEYKVYKNENMHVKFDLEFAKALNVEVSRLLGWIRTKEDIKKEFSSEMAQGAEKYFKANYACIGNNSLLLLSTKKKPNFEVISEPEQLRITIDKVYNDCLETVLKTIDNFNGIIETQDLEKCLKILETQQGFIYRNCLIIKAENKTKIEFREITDYNKFLKEVA